MAVEQPRWSPLYWPACMIRTGTESHIVSPPQIHKIGVSVWIWKHLKNRRFFEKDKVVTLFSNDQDETNLTNFTSYPWAEMLIKCLLSKSYSELKLKLQAAFKGLSLLWPADTCRHLPTPAVARHPFRCRRPRKTSQWAFCGVTVWVRGPEVTNE